ncbi:MAG: hypothetical protein L6Q37_08630 [Bdellovibrionaceae bacterium]|nr:hypothetical protein [Pseudobdellovibrionaceae bacterium]NUM58061.1 hypothetical protein [Pseudobdellovibrionaceae bacterium]
MISRRNFLNSTGKKLVASTIGLKSLFSFAQGASLNTSTSAAFISVIQGDCFDGFSQFSVLTINRKNLRFFLFKNNQLIEEIPSHIQKHPSFNSRIDKLFVKGLQTETYYELRIIENNAVIDSRFFKSLNSDKLQYRIALVSCMDAKLHKPQMWQSLLQQQADLILFIGDSVYADAETNGPANGFHLWRSFANSRFTLDIYKWRYLVPILSVWDDHDFGHDNSGNFYPYIKESTINFKTFFAQDYQVSPNLTHGPGISSAFKLGSLLIILLDGRSFRHHPGTQDLFGMFGLKQETWVYQVIKNHPGPILLVNGSQWFSDSGVGESFNHDYTENFKQFITHLKSLNKKILFASGDVHFSELISIPKNILGYQTYEITSSAMHSLTAPGIPQFFKTKNSFLSTWRHNFNLLDFRTTSFGNQFSIACMGESNSAFYKYSFWL